MINITSNQINFLNYKEGQFHNRVIENETRRHNIRYENETVRHNTATEYLTSQTLLEQKRHNYAQEQIGRQANAVQYATGMANANAHVSSSIISAAASRYNADKQFAANVYATQKSYASSIYATDANVLSRNYATDKQFQSNIYGTNVNAVTKLRTTSQTNQTNLTSAYVSAMIGAYARVASSLIGTVGGFYGKKK